MFTHPRSGQSLYIHETELCVISCFTFTHWQPCVPFCMPQAQILHPQHLCAGYLSMTERCWWRMEGSQTQPTTFRMRSEATKSVVPKVGEMQLGRQWDTSLTNVWKPFFFCIQFPMFSFLNRQLGCLHQSCCQQEVFTGNHGVFPLCFFLGEIPGL